MVEIDALKASDDEDEIGVNNPHIRSLIAYNAESKVVESMRPNGVLMAQITPRGGLISGTSSVVQLDAWNWEDAVIKTDDAIHMNWPGSFTSGKWWLGEDPALKPDKNYAKKISDIKLYFTNAKAYLASQLAQRQGAILPVITAEYEDNLIQRLLTEKTISVDTTASGGNTQLMTLDENEA